MYIVKIIKVKFRINNGELEGIVGDEFDNNKKFHSDKLAKAKVITSKTKTFNQILIENNAPKEVDYLSLDIEGGEYEALKNFEFKQYKWKFLTIERPN